MGPGQIVTGFHSRATRRGPALAAVQAELESKGPAIMTYGQKVNDSRLFPVEITTIERTPEGHTKLVLAHSSSALGGATTTGHIILRTDEAAALADELRTISQSDQPHDDDRSRSSSRRAS